MQLQALENSMLDADGLVAHGYVVIRRGVRESYYALAAILVCVVLIVVFGVVAARSPDGTYDGMLAANWSMLGVVVAIGALNFAWGWYASRRRLCETGRRIIRRAEYQRRLAALRLSEAEHETLR